MMAIMSGHGANTIFFINKKNKYWTSRTLANPPPPTSDSISFLPYPSSRLHKFRKIPTLKNSRKYLEKCLWWNIFLLNLFIWTVTLLKQISTLFFFFLEK